MSKRTFKLSLDLELALLNAIARGLVVPGVVSEEELSKEGRATFSAIKLLLDEIKPPLPYRSIWLTCIELFGLDKSTAEAFIKQLESAGVGLEVKTILQKVHDKQLLVDLINEAGGQLGRGSLDVGGLSLLLNETKSIDSIVSVGEQLGQSLPDPPNGLTLHSLPSLSSKTGGIIGLWAIAGETGCGKSTLAWQIALDVAKQGVKVLYYDLENGFAVLMDRTATLFNRDLNLIRVSTNNIYYRDSIRTLDSDLSSVLSPALVVVDSVQKLPASMEYRRASLDRWVHRLESLKKRGYFVLLVSEIGRASYDADPHVGAFKETGEIEYSADCGIQVVPYGEHSEAVALHVVKNRHRKFKGYFGLLIRQRDWMFQEKGD